MSAVVLPPGACTCVVRTFREGVLAAVGHDLSLDAPPQRVTVDVAARTLEATFDPKAIRLRGAVVDGREDPSALSAGDRDKIRRNLLDTVLAAGKHPAITFQGRWTPAGDGAPTLEGTLSLHGATQPVKAAARVEGDHVVAEFVLRPSAWGIAPFVALLGALRVRDEVRVTARLPAQSLQG